MPLGFSEQEVYQQVAFPIEKGDLLVFYSDGLTEARNAAGEFFGVERLMEEITTHSRLAPDQILSKIHSAVIAFSGEAESRADDLTCVIVSLQEPEGESSLAHAHYQTTSNITELASIRRFIRAFCRRPPAAMLDGASLDELELAVAEAASNVMRHAYHGRTDQPLRIVADAFSDRVLIRLFHYGAAFDPATVRLPAFDGSREGGFGVYIIAHSVDDVHYSRDERGENCISLVKKKISKKGERPNGADV